MNSAPHTMMNKFSFSCFSRLVSDSNSYNHVFGFTFVVGAMACAPVNAQVVQKAAEPFESASWRAADDNSAEGRVQISANVPAELGAMSKSALELEANFAGKGFQFFKAGPSQPL